MLLYNSVHLGCAHLSPRQVSLFCGRVPNCRPENGWLMYTYIHIHTNLYMHTHTYIRTHTHLNTCICMLLYNSVNLGCAHLSPRQVLLFCGRVPNCRPENGRFIYTYIHIHTNLYMHTHTYIRTHTHLNTCICVPLYNSVNLGCTHLSPRQVPYFCCFLPNCRRENSRVYFGGWAAGVQQGPICHYRSHNQFHIGPEIINTFNKRTRD